MNRPQKTETHMQKDVARRPSSVSVSFGCQGTEFSLWLLEMLTARNTPSRLLHSLPDCLVILCLEAWIGTAVVFPVLCLSFTHTHAHKGTQTHARFRVYLAHVNECIFTFPAPLPSPPFLALPQTWSDYWRDALYSGMLLRWWRGERPPPHSLHFPPPLLHPLPLHPRIALLPRLPVF